MSDINVNLISSHWKDLKKEQNEMLQGMVIILCQELPEMIGTSIIHKVYSPDYLSMVIFKEDKIIGGIVFRIFTEANFAELSLCAIIANEKGKGYGAAMVNYMKDYLVLQNIGHVITCSDESTPEFYRRVGFTRHVTLDKEKIKKCVSYDNSILMQCDLESSVSYVDSKRVITEQIDSVDNWLEANKFCVRLPGYKLTKDLPRQVPPNCAVILEKLGIKNTIYEDESAELRPKLSTIIENMIKTQWIYLFVGDRNTKPPGYWKIIDPNEYIDISIIQQRLNRSYYSNLHLFSCDISAMIRNVQDFYDPETQPYKDSEKMKEFYILQLVNEKLIPS